MVRNTERRLETEMGPLPLDSPSLGKPVLADSGDPTTP